LTGTLFCAFGFAPTRPAGRRLQSVSVATVGSAIAVRNAGWKYGDDSDMRLTVATSKASREGSAIAFASGAIAIRSANPP